MRRLLIYSVTVCGFAVPALAGAAGFDRPSPDCALEAQRSVARRHHLRAASDESLSLRIYSDPRLAQEADDAFDACVRRGAS
jgi:hypothetical protein